MSPLACACMHAPARFMNGWCFARMHPPLARLRSKPTSRRLWLDYLQRSCMCCMSTCMHVSALVALCFAPWYERRPERRTPPPTHTLLARTDSPSDGGPEQCLFDSDSKLLCIFVHTRLAPGTAPVKAYVQQKAMNLADPAHASRVRQPPSFYTGGDRSPRPSRPNGTHRHTRRSAAVRLPSRCKTAAHC